MGVLGQTEPHRNVPLLEFAVVVRVMAKSLNDRRCQLVGSILSHSLHVRCLEGHRHQSACCLVCEQGLNIDLIFEYDLWVFKSRGRSVPKA